MRAKAFGLVWAALALAAIASVAPSAGATKVNPVVAKMIDAFGGATVIQSIKTRVVTIAVAVQGESALITTTYERPNLLVQVEQVPALHYTLTYGYDGTRAWARDTYGHVQEQTGNDLTRLKCLADGAIEAVLASGGSSDAAIQSSRTTVNGKQYDVLRVTQPACPETTLLLDTTTHLIMRETNGSQTNDYSNYAVDPAGEQYPKTIVASADGVTSVGTVVSVQDNVTLDPSIFAMPAPGSSPAPAPGLATAAPSPSPTPIASPSPTHT